MEKLSQFQQYGNALNSETLTVKEIIHSKQRKLPPQMVKQEGDVKKEVNPPQGKGLVALPKLRTSAIRCREQIEDVEVLFHYAPPLSSQKEVMKAVISACNSSSHALIESPTGTGKTAALLCSSLAWQRKFHVESGERQNVGRIVYCTRTHKQASQVIAELNQSPYQPATVHLASRKYLCPYMSSSIAKSAMSSIYQTLRQSAVDLENDRFPNDPSSLRRHDVMNSRKKLRGNLRAELSTSYDRHSYLDENINSRRESKKDKKEDDDEQKSTSMKDSSTPSYFRIKKEREDEKGLTVRNGAERNEIEERNMPFQRQDTQGSRVTKNESCCCKTGSIKEGRRNEKGGQKEQQKGEKARPVMKDVISGEAHFSPSLIEATLLSIDFLQDSLPSSYRRARSSPAAIVPSSLPPSSSFSSSSSSSSCLGSRREELRIPLANEGRSTSLEIFSSRDSLDKSPPSPVKNHLLPDRGLQESLQMASSLPPFASSLPALIKSEMHALQPLRRASSRTIDGDSTRRNKEEGYPRLLADRYIATSRERENSLTIPSREVHSHMLKLKEFVYKGDNEKQSDLRPSSSSSSSSLALSCKRPSIGEKKEFYGRRDYQSVEHVKSEGGDEETIFSSENLLTPNDRKKDVHTQRNETRSCLVKTELLDYYSSSLFMSAPRRPRRSRSADGGKVLVQRTMSDFFRASRGRKGHERRDSIKQEKSFGRTDTYEGGSTSRDTLQVREKTSLNQNTSCACSHHHSSGLVTSSSSSTWVRSKRIRGHDVESPLRIDPVPLLRYLERLLISPPPSSSSSSSSSFASPSPSSSSSPPPLSRLSKEDQSLSSLSTSSRQRGERKLSHHTTPSPHRQVTTPVSSMSQKSEKPSSPFLLPSSIENSLPAASRSSTEVPSSQREVKNLLKQEERPTCLRPVVLDEACCRQAATRADKWRRWAGRLRSRFVAPEEKRGGGSGRGGDFTYLLEMLLNYACMISENVRSSSNRLSKIQEGDEEEKKSMSLRRESEKELREKKETGKDAVMRRRCRENLQRREQKEGGDEQRMKEKETGEKEKEKVTMRRGRDGMAVSKEGREEHHREHRSEENSLRTSEAGDSISFTLSSDSEGFKSLQGDREFSENKSQDRRSALSSSSSSSYSVHRTKEKSVMWNKPDGWICPFYVRLGEGYFVERLFERLRPPLMICSQQKKEGHGDALSQDTSSVVKSRRDQGAKEQEDNLADEGGDEEGKTEESDFKVMDVEEMASFSLRCMCSYPSNASSRHLLSSGGTPMRTITDNSKQTKTSSLLERNLPLFKKEREESTSFTRRNNPCPCPPHHSSTTPCCSTATSLGMNRTKMIIQGGCGKCLGEKNFFDEDEVLEKKKDAKVETQSSPFPLPLLSSDITCRDTCLPGGLTRPEDSLAFLKLKQERNSGENDVDDHRADLSMSLRRQRDKWTELVVKDKVEMKTLKDTCVVGACPYYSTLGFLPFADLVVCPYTYVLDPNIARRMRMDEMLK
ncbi:helicase, partial [Cystoisospora suis]